MLMSNKTTHSLAILLIAATVLGVTLAAWAKKPGRPDPTPPDPVIAYSDGGNLRVMDADGGNNELVLRNAGFSVSLKPRWSPDGEQFTYFGHDRDLGRGIFTHSLDGSNRELLVVAQAAPYWSFGDVLGQGEKIVFSYPTDAQFIDYMADLGHDRVYDIFIMNPDGSGRRHLIKTDLDERQIAWSPDGQWLAVIVLHVYPVDQLYIYELGLTSGKITVVNKTNIHEEAADAGVTLPTDLTGIDWANNGDKLALSSRVNGMGTPSELFLVDLTTYEKTQVITDSDFASGFIQGASFSPDDSKLAFSLRGADRKTEGTYSVNIDGRDTVITKLAKANTAPSPDWWVGSDD